MFGEGGKKIKPQTQFKNLGDSLKICLGQMPPVRNAWLYCFLKTRLKTYILLLLSIWAPLWNCKCPQSWNKQWFFLATRKV